MAAFAGVAGTILLLTVAPHGRAEEKIVVKQVHLNVRIAGLGQDGCEVEVKPAHPGCRFEKVTQHVGKAGEETLLIKNIECRNADRDCSFAITVKEPGQTDTTVRRGFQLPASDASRPARTPYFECFISSPSKIARAEAERTRR